MTITEDTTMENKLSLPEIVGKMQASNTIIEIELSVALEVYGDNIPAHRIKDILDSLRKRMETTEQAWENRA
jgi:hypothetical protein